MKETTTTPEQKKLPQQTKNLSMEEMVSIFAERAAQLWEVPLVKEQMVAISNKEGNEAALKWFHYQVLGSLFFTKEEIEDIVKQKNTQHHANNNNTPIS